MAEKRTIELEVNSNLGTLKQQFKEAQQEVQILSEKFGATSAQAVQAAKSAAILKDKIGDAKALTDAFNPDAKFKALSGSLTGVAGGFSVVTGAMGAFGKQSEDVEQALLKVQAAMALTSGLQAVGESIDSFKQLGAVVTNFGTKAVASFRAMTAANKVFMVTGIGLLLVALGGVVAYWEDISKALGKNSKAQELNNKVSNASIQLISKELNAADVLAKQLKSEILTREEKRKKVAQFQEQYPTILSNINAEKSSLQDINTALVKNIGLLKLQAQAKAIQGLREESYTQLLKEQMELKTGAAEEEFSVFGVKIGGIAYGEDASNGMLSFVDAQDAAAISTSISTKALEKNISALDEMDASIQKQMETLEKQGAVIVPTNAPAPKSAGQSGESKAEARAAAAREKAEKAEADRIERIKTLNDNLTAYYDAIEENRQSKITDAKEKEEQETANKYEALYALAEKAGISTADLQKEHGDELLLIKKKYDDLEKAAQAEKIANEKIAEDERIAKNKERIENEKTFLDGITLSENELKLKRLRLQYEAERVLYKDNAEILAALDAKYKKDTEELNKEAIAKIAAADKEAAEKKQALLNSQLDAVKKGLTSIANIAELFAGKSKASQKRAFNVQKATNIATATIDTFTSAQSAYKSVVGVPVVGPVLAPLAAAGAIAAGLINIRKIKESQFEGGAEPSASGGGGGGGGAVQAPQFNVVGNNGMNQLAQLQQKPVQAYVVSSEMTSAQALERNRINNATI